MQSGSYVLSGVNPYRLYTEPYPMTYCSTASNRCIACSLESSTLDSVKVNLAPIKWCKESSKKHNNNVPTVNREYFIIKIFRAKVFHSK